MKNYFKLYHYPVGYHGGMHRLTKDQWLTMLAIVMALLVPLLVLFAYARLVAPR